MSIENREPAVHDGTAAGRRRAGRAAATSGAAAALIAGAALTTFLPRMPFPPVAVAGAIVRSTPGGVATFFIELLQHQALPLVVVATTAGFVGVAALLGGVLPALSRRLPGGAATASAVLGSPMYLVAISALLPDSQTVGRAAYAAGLLPVFAAGALVGAWRFDRLTKMPDVAGSAPPDPSRREAVRALWIGAAGLFLGWAGLGRLLFRRPDPGDLALRAGDVRTAAVPSPAPGDRAFSRIPGLTPELTDNHRFYVVDEEIIDPDIDPNGWTLGIGGFVDHSFELSYEELTAMPAVEQFTTLECISNPVGGPLMSTARWTGIPLRELLLRAGIRDGAREIVSTAVGDYSDSITLDQAMRPDTLVVIGMNRQMLPRAHGFPARLLVPGLYGMKQPKWLERIDVVDRPYRGYWEVRGWSKAAVVKTGSRIDTAVPYPEQSADYVVAGVAFAGDRGISGVEVSLDGGATWDDAQLKTPLSGTTWRLWRYPFHQQPDGAASITILARATDGDGRLQIQTVADPHPNGASGYPALTLGL